MEGSHYCVYILTDEQHSKLYTGRTGNLKRRISQHRSGNGGIYTRTWNLTRLVYYELVRDDGVARMREKMIKHYSKKQRVKMIEDLNPDWVDLFNKIDT